MTSGINTFIRTALALLILILGQACATTSQSNAQPEFEVFYIPRTAELYVPPAESELESKAFYRFKIASSPLEKLFDEAKNQSRTPISPSTKLRVKIRKVSSGEEVLLETDGGVVEHGQRVSVSISTVRDAFAEIVSAAKAQPQKHPFILDPVAELAF